MKIALINSEYPSPSGLDHGGIATYTYTLAKYLAAGGHTVHLLTRSSIHANINVPGIQFHQFGFKKHKNLLHKLLSRFSNNPIYWEKAQAHSVSLLLTQITQNIGLDIVEFPEYGGLAYYYHKKNNPPCICTFHMPTELVDTINNQNFSNSKRWCYRLETKAIFNATVYKSPSKTLKSYVCDHYHLPASSVTVIRNPLDPKPFQVVKRTLLDKDQFDILFCGRFERRKGAELILQCIKNILSIDPSITVTIAGETEITGAQNYRYAIERILTQEERRRVWFPGPLSRQQLFSLYYNSSLFLLPSLYENAPYSLLEAMAAGLPVIASDRGGIGEIITHNVNGLLFSPDNPSELLSYIAELFRSSEKVQSLSKNAVQTILQQYAPDKTIEDHISLYQSVINNNR